MRAAVHDSAPLRELRSKLICVLRLSTSAPPAAWALS
jgi:hypothetical protein